jgi:thiol-disulfide isomerase/thioredoxin
MAEGISVLEAPVVVLVVHQEGCPACEEYLPRFQRIAERYARCIPHLVVDANVYPDAADALKVESTPTTLVLRHGRMTSRNLTGAAEDADIEKLFVAASRGMECVL